MRVSLPVVFPSLRDPRWGQIASLSAFTVLGQTALNFKISLPQLAVVVTTSVLTDLALLLRSRHQVIFPASGVITGLSLGLLLRGPGLGLFVVCALAAILSKELIRVRGKHVFNPSNFGIVFVLFLFGGQAGLSPGQWGSSLVLLFVLVNAGVFVVFGVRRFDVVVAFLATYALAEVVRLALSGELSGLGHQVVTASVVLFAFFMITDPRTSPGTRAGRLVYASATSAVAVILEALGVRAGLFFALAAVCVLVPTLDIAAEHHAGRPVVAFTWPGERRSGSDSRPA